MRRVGAGLALVMLAGCSAGQINDATSKAPILAPPAPELTSTSTPAVPVTAEVTTTTEAEPEPTTVPVPTIPPLPVPATTRYLQPETTTGAGPVLAYGEWAIPKYIVGCETGGTYSWNAYNASSGAAGPYQLMPEHFGDDARNHSHAEQHAMAAKLWNGGKGASNWAACL